MTTKAHIRYKTRSGILVPGVTTVLSLLAKPALIHWAWKLGMEGEDYRKVKERAADIGTVAHYLVECDIRGLDPDLSEFSPKVVEHARVAFGAYQAWRQGQNLNTLACELPLVSEEWLYGGTIDWMAKTADGALWLIDIKTSKGIYDEMRYQLAAYWRMWDEVNPDRQISQACILQLDKETGDPSFHTFSDLRQEFEIFLRLREIYALQKKMDPNRDKIRKYTRLGKLS